MIVRVLIALTTIVAVGTLAGCQRSIPPPSPAEALRSRIEASAEPDLIDFTYKAAGTSVATCFRPNREFSGFVDYDDGVVVLRRVVERDAEAIAMVTPNDVVIRSSLVAQSDPEPLWLRLPRTVLPDARAPISSALGSDLASYLLSGELPSTPQETLLAALDVAEGVRSAGSEQIAGQSATGWVIDVDAGAYEGAIDDEVTAATTSSSADPPPVPEFVAWFDPLGDIVRLEVRLDRAEGAAAGNDETPGGWVIDYRVLEERPNLPVPNPVVDLDGPALSGLKARPIETCEVPL